MPFKSYLGEGGYCKPMVERTSKVKVKTAVFFMRFILLFELSALGCTPFTVVFMMKLSFFVKLIAIWHVKFCPKMHTGGYGNPHLQSYITRGNFRNRVFSEKLGFYG